MSIIGGIDSYPTNSIVEIMLAEDDSDDSELFHDALSELSLPYHLTIVNNGEDLMNKLHGNNMLPTILFLDINMPKKNGIECLMEIKNDDALKNIRVVMLSTNYNEKTIREMYGLGAQHAIIKPVEFFYLKKLISFVIEFALTEDLKQASEDNFLLLAELNHEND